ncbi:MAG: Gfo/Idh/MocA family oxidoreductase [Gemmatimonadaceae bacterium]|nr:Gfo/Idh/MocA family oxidoreductase [Gemmatimonadaceae bacterium]
MNNSNNISRRQMLKSTAAVATAAATFTALGTNYAWAAGSDVLKVGLIGCGGRGTGAAFDSASASPRVQIVAMGDLFKDRLENSRGQLKTTDTNKGIGAQYAVKDDNCFVGFDAYKKVIDSDVDMVLLCEPPGFRPRSFRYAVEKGRHVFFEKPVAVDPAQVRSVIETADLAGTKNLGVVAGTLFRHHTTHLEILKRVRDGDIGDIIAGNSYYNATELWFHKRGESWTDTEFQIRNWLYYTWLSGDLIVEQNVHRIDVMDWFMGAHPVAAYGMGGRQVRTDEKWGNIYDHFTIEYEYPGGVKVVNMCRQQDGTETRVNEIFRGTKGTAEPLEGRMTINGDKIKFKKEPLGDAYIREHKDLIESIEKGKPLNEGRQIAETTLTAIMGRMSAYTGKRVTWDQAMSSTLDLFPKTTMEFGPMAVPPIPQPGKEPLV